MTAQNSQPFNNESYQRPARMVTGTNETVKRSSATLKMLLLNATPTGLPELMTLAELCAFLKVKPHYIYSLTSTDRIPYCKFAGTLRFDKAEILQWLERGRRGPRMSGPAEGGR